MTDIYFKTFGYNYDYNNKKTNILVFYFHPFIYQYTINNTLCLEKKITIKLHLIQT